MKTLVILISGRGSNMEALVRAAREEGWPVKLAGVVSNRPEAEGLAWARAEGLPVAVVDHRTHADRDAFDAALAAAIDTLAATPAGPDLIALAGFMRVLGRPFVERYAGRMFNVHPSLLPAFPGLHTHRRAIEAGCRYAGATVHGVTADLDHGPILAQACVPVLPGDDAAALAARILPREHAMYVAVLRALVHDRLVRRDGRWLHLDDEPLAF